MPSYASKTKFMSVSNLLKHIPRNRAIEHCTLLSILKLVSRFPPLLHIYFESLNNHIIDFLLFFFFVILIVEHRLPFQRFGERILCWCCNMSLSSPVPLNFHFRFLQIQVKQMRGRFLVLVEFEYSTMIHRKLSFSICVSTTLLWLSF